MKISTAYDVSIGIDDTGAIINGLWDCPYCEMPNNVTFFSRNVTSVDQQFEMDITCRFCDKESTVQFLEATDLYA